jgi:choline kinase
MQAIILAAGMGRRLGALTSDNTKCMLEVNGKRLIHRALDALVGIGISRVVLVVGYKADNVRVLVGDSYKGMEVVYVENSI